MTQSELPGFGALVISLDFELHWGIRDKHAAHGPMREALLGARSAIPRLLALFREREISATWAIVGFLMTKDRDEMARLEPAVRPSYVHARLNPYSELVGKDEDDDPVHFAGSLVEMIRQTPGQEIATHTYSHYFCTEAGQTVEAFRGDLKAASAVAAARGVRLESIVFPRNQRNPAYDAALLESGLRAYRGNPESWMWRFEDSEDSATYGKRAARLLDHYLNITGHNLLDWSAVAQPSGLCDVRASRVLRPYSELLGPADPLRARRIRRSLEAAAATRRIYHLWWHPHNMGTNIGRNIDFLRRLLDAYADCKARWGMRSLSMSEVVELVHGSTPRAGGVALSRGPASP
jgi:peptidoglycan/xylan/chitin deacetylase (PgdA/CDA1 family)